MWNNYISLTTTSVLNLVVRVFFFFFRISLASNSLTPRIFVCMYQYMFGG